MRFEEESSSSSSWSSYNNNSGGKLKPELNRQLPLINDKVLTDKQCNEGFEGTGSLGLTLLDLAERFRFIKLVGAIKLLAIDAPKLVQAGQAISLKCLVDSRKDKLLSLSWSKNGREFYRFEPYSQAKQLYLIFNTTGINLDVSVKSLQN